MNVILLIISYSINIANAIFRGYVLKVMWSWFIMSQFPSMPNISVVGAIGISCILELFQLQGMSFTEYKQIEEHDSDEFTMWHFKRSYYGVIATFISWGAGAIIHHFM